MLPALTDESSTLSDSNNNIAQLIDLANNHFPDILPESVSKHCGYNASAGGNRQCFERAHKDTVRGYFCHIGRKKQTPEKDNYRA